MRKNGGLRPGRRAIGRLAAIGAAAVMAAVPIPPLRPQFLQQSTGVINVEVPVRVFDGDRFVEDLTLGDFEVLENGQPQKIVAFYFVKRTNIQKEELPVPPAAAPAAAPRAAGQPVPKTARTIVLQFEVLEPLPKIDDAVDYFFNEVLQPGDAVAVVTPRGTYHLKPETVAQAARPEIAQQIKDRLRADILAGATGYRRLLDNIRDAMRLPMEADQKMEIINGFLRQLRDRLGIDTPSLQRMANGLKALEGQKYVFLFYQKELALVPDFGEFGDESVGSAMDSLSDAAIADVHRTPDITPKMIQQIFSDASVTANLIFLTQSTLNRAGLDGEQQRGGALEAGRGGLLAKDLSASIFSSLKQVAKATGGISESSGNPFAAFRKAVAATENYYLLYYVPADYRADGKFREITVRVKGKGYRVSNRAGYFAN
jgi:VWFA-related protein